MSFTLYESNDLKVLATYLSELLLQHRTANRADPFAEELVIVPNRALGQWLMLQTAQNNGISTPMELLYPGAFLYQYLFARLPGMAEAHSATAPPFTPASITWLLYRLLGQLETDTDFKAVGEFIDAQAARRFQLATRLAALYDRYMTYRPALLHTWERAAPAGNWQAQLWHTLIKESRAARATPHFSDLYTRLRSLKGGSLEEALQPLIGRTRQIYYFGTTSLPPTHLDLLLHIARLPQVNIHLLAINPSRQEWSEARSLKRQLRAEQSLVELAGAELAGNYLEHTSTLLGSLGRSGRDFFTLLLACEEEIGRTSHFVPPPPAPLNKLQALQAGILDNEPLGTIPRMDDDDSITLHSCHSPLREIEVLHDLLLARFAADPELTPRDVVVYLPSIEDYAPYIEAVFSSTATGRGQIPYTIHDRSLRATNQVCQTFLLLLDSLGGRFKSSEVLQLLQDASIREYCALSSDNLIQLGALLKSANLKWGLNETFKAQHGAAASSIHSWQFALERLLLGVAMQSAAHLDVSATGGLHESYPLEEAQGFGASIGQLAGLIERLKQLHILFTGTEHSCQDWHGMLVKLLEEFFNNSASDPAMLTIMRQILATFRENYAHAGCAALPIPFGVMRAWLHQTLDGRGSAVNFFTGRVTFATFEPMRNVPCRIVCLVGMNDGAFPRHLPALSFDLMEDKTGRRLGDRSLADEDRYAFLETLLSARQELIITYSGQSARDNRELPPAVLVSEVRDSLRLQVLRHPLHPFSARYFTAGSPLRSYGRTNYLVAQHLNSAPPDTPQIARCTPATPPESASAHRSPAGELSQPLELDLDLLTAFYCDPTRYFYNHVLKTRLTIHSDELPTDTEDGSVDALTRYHLKEELLKHWQNGCNDTQLERLLHYLEGSGALPCNSRELFNENLDEVKKLCLLKEAAGIGAQSASVTLKIAMRDNLTLHAALKLYDDGKLLLMRPAKGREKDMLTLKLRHWAACAAGEQVTGHAIFSDTTVKQLNSPLLPLPPEQALQRLQQLVDNFLLRRDRPSCFAPEIGRLLHENKPITRDRWCGGPYSAGVSAFLKHAYGQEPPAPESGAWDEMRHFTALLYG